jgi:hypothetical protein
MLWLERRFEHRPEGRSNVFNIFWKTPLQFLEEDGMINSVSLSYLSHLFTKYIFLTPFSWGF